MRLVYFALLVLGLTACGGGSNIPTAPAQNAPTVDGNALSTRVSQTIIAGLTESAPTALPPTNTPKATSTPEATNTPPATAPPPAAALEILDTADVTDSLGYLHILGEIKNVSDEPHSFVKAIVTLYDASDQVIATQFSFTLLDVIPPGATAPFDVIFTHDVKGSKRYTTQADSNRGGEVKTGLRITSHKSSTDSLGYFHVVGVVKNESSSPATFVKIIVTMYDASGKITGTAFSFTTLDTVGPGQTSPFDVIATLSLKGTAKYQVALDWN